MRKLKELAEKLPADLLLGARLVGKTTLARDLRSHPLL